MTSSRRSASSRSPSEVEPVTSPNRTVTSLRSETRAAAATGWPHEKQHRAPWGSGVPQFEHVAASSAPHEAQKPASSGFSVPHAGHVFTGSVYGRFRDGDRMRPLDEEVA